ncbi:CBS domain-containing protein [Haloplanus sp. GCM10025708]|uniref:CBS domain-containing protein n=1 Tax=Haloferacaceae TaxID=1644056 RepID=UPI00361E263B
MTLADFARTDVLTAAPDTPVDDVAAAMRDHDDDLVVVLDEQRPLGALTAADLGRAFVAGERLADRRAADLLAGDPVTVRATADREALVDAFDDEAVERALVVDDEGGFVGVVTLRDALVQYGRELEAAFDLLERR